MTTEAQKLAANGVESAVRILNAALEAAAAVGVCTKLETMRLDRIGRPPYSVVTVTCVVKVNA